MSEFTQLVLLFFGTVFVNNFILVRFLGICPFLGVSKQVETAMGMGLATTFVMTLTGAATWLINTYILEALNLPFLQYVSFIIVIASLVQFVEMFIKKTSPVLYKSLGIFLPLITTNCAILGLALLIPLNGYSFIGSTVFGFGAGIGFTLAIVLMAGLREKLEFGDVPGVLKGVPVTLIIAGIMAMAFMGFSGLITI
ncbi:MAG: electron transport complex protein RnfA [Halanaerobium sp.]|jgi:electron transport complex protein RnfA|uniref:Ion-translocating oxidoreductase complex subunit A n=1 Tax=Halanaerobium congolense TaxID=54121 RepID=A0A1M7L8L8_9FIRM|nr:electron transport complex subunit RsxA [Halanaerobium congolense]PUU91568.1 MAG: electron transport complex protein RnfA [Halanaerobium sp.]PXV63251.1 electron transport complex protein RnfA [Halanaerobium congolense]TDX39358.1 electron transport complex protein RnfA [Halanaerobium congolense]SHM74244.1 electron transport complex protein RnfA [Halanaerobium congolense]